jgi:cytochrome d ubiquinol oxidase subunit II
MSYDTLILFWVTVLAFAILVYGLLDGFDLGVGMLFGLTRKDDDRGAMMAAIAPSWDGNETWLILIGTILFGAFSQIYAVLLAAFYIPILLMLIGLIFRGVAFEFRHHASAKMRPYWDLGFWVGSGVVAFVQGAALGTMIVGIPVTNRLYAGGSFVWLKPFPILSGLGLMLGYALLGACWLVMRGEDALRPRALAWGRRAAVGMAIILFVSAVLTFVLRLEAWNGGLERPWVWVLPVIWAGLMVMLVKALRVDERSRRPFILAALSFVSAFTFLAATFWPWMVPGSITVAAAASPEASLRFMFWGAGLFALPVIIIYTIVIYRIFRTGPVNTYG